MQLFNVEFYAVVIPVDKHGIIHKSMNIRSKQILDTPIRSTAQGFLKDSIHRVFYVNIHRDVEECI